MPRILDGNRVRDDIKSELKPRVDALAARGRPPGLAVVLVGHHPASEIYVRNKIKACHDLGIHSESITPPDSISTAELLAIVEGLNARPDIDGILVQLPLPPHIDTKRILMAVAPAKAVVLVGHHPASEIYVRNKIKPCHDLGIHSESITPPDSISTAELLAIEMES